MMKRLLPLAAAASIALFGASAKAEFLDFVVDEGSVPGAVANTFAADKLNGGYNERLSFGPGGTFSAQAFANFGQYFANEGTSLVSTQLNGFGAGGYGLYAVFTATGTVSGSSFSGTSGAFTLYIDPGKDTTATLTDGFTAPTLSGTVDDYMIAFSTNGTGVGDTVGPPGRLRPALR